MKRAPGHKQARSLTGRMLFLIVIIVIIVIQTYRLHRFIENNPLKGPARCNIYVELLSDLGQTLI